MVNVVPFKIEHLDGLKMRDDAVALAYGNDFKDLARLYEGSGHAWTLLDGEKVIFCGGVWTMWKGVGEAWCIMGDEVARYPLAVVKTLKAKISGLCYRRIQATVRASDKQARDLIALCGFKAEGLLEAYGPEGSDYVMYGRVA